MAAAKGRRVSADCTYSYRRQRPSEFADPLDGFIDWAAADLSPMDSPLHAFQQVTGYVGMPNLGASAVESVPST